MRRFLLGMLVVIGACLGTSPVLAQSESITDCDVKIIDKTTDRVLDVTQVNAAIARLEGVGADVRVRAFQEAPGSLDAYQADHVRDCASWQGPGGVTKGNLVTLLFSLDRKSAIFYGGDFGGELSAVVDGIRDQTMRDQLRAGNFTGAIVASLDAVSEELTPFDWSEFWKRLSVLAAAVVGVIVLILLVWLLFNQLEKLRVRRERLRQTRQRAFTLSRKAEALYMSIDDGRGQLSTAFCGVMNILSGDVKGAFDRDLRALLVKVFDLKRRWEIVTADEALAAMRTQSDADNCVAIWSDILELSREINDGVQALIKRCCELEEEAENAPKELEETLRLLGELSKLQASFVALGFKPVVDAGFLEVEQEYTEAASRMIEERDYSGAIAILGEAQQRYAMATATIHEISERRADLIRRLARAQENAELFPDQLADAGEALGHARETYRQSNWEGLQGLFDHLKKKTGQWHTTRVAAERALSMEVQDWTKAASLVTELEEVIRKVSQECAHLMGQVTSLDVLANSAPQLLAEVTADIQSRMTAINGYKGDQSSAKREISALESYDLVCLRALLEQESPCYVDFKRYYEQLVASLKRIAAEAKARHESVVAEEKRRRDEEEAARRARQAADNAAAAIAVASYTPLGGCSGGSGVADGGGGSSGSF